MCYAMLQRVGPGLQIAAKSQKHFVGQSDNYQLDISESLKSVGGEFHWKSIILPTT